jgi:hypothetical protein
MDKRNGQALQRHAFPGQRIMHTFLTPFVEKWLGSLSHAHRSADPPLARLNVRARLTRRTEARMQSHRPIVASWGRGPIWHRNACPFHC